MIKHALSICYFYLLQNSFWESLHRKFMYNTDENYIIITHGITARVLVARYFKWDVETFQMLQNPGNCEVGTNVKI